MALAYDYSMCVENHDTSVLRDEIFLPASKIDIVYATLYAIANASTSREAGVFSASLLTLADYQEAVWNEPSSSFSADIGIAALTPEALIKGMPSMRLEKYAALVNADKKELQQAAKIALKMNVLIVPWYVRLWHWLTGQGQFHRSYAGFVDFPD